MRSSARTYPVLRGKKVYLPHTPVCSACRRRPVEPHAFAAFAFGALIREADDTAWGLDERLQGFCWLHWHGAREAGDSAHLRLADEVVGGQGEFYFCSTSCLRRFLNGSVDALERRMAQPSARNATGPARRIAGATREALFVTTHRYSAHHRKRVLASRRCGCFHCLAMFRREEIARWTDRPAPRADGVTALCPRCGIDAVLPDNMPRVRLTRAFLRAMHARWFKIRAEPGRAMITERDLPAM